MAPKQAEPSGDPGQSKGNAVPDLLVSLFFLSWGSWRPGLGVKTPPPSVPAGASSSASSRVRPIFTGQMVGAASRLSHPCRVTIPLSMPRKRDSWS